MDITILVCTLVMTAMSVLAILSLLGFNHQLRQRSSDTSAEISAALKNSREKRLWLAVILSALSVALSGASFYRFERPIIAEKVVEKPVDRVVEKIVQAECPKPQFSIAPNRAKGRQGSQKRPGVVIPASAIERAETHAPISAAVGINSGTVTVGEAGPDLKLTKLQENVLDEGRYRTDFSLSIHSKRVFSLRLTATGSSIADAIKFTPDDNSQAVMIMNEKWGNERAESTITNAMSGHYMISVYSARSDTIVLVAE